MAERNETIKNLKPGHYVIIDNEPCRIVNIILSRPGKHGSTKAKVEGVGIFDDKKRFILKPADAEIQVPIIEKKKAQVISISGDFAQLMDLENYSTFEAIIPTQFKGKLEAGKEIGYWKISNRILIKEV